MSASDCFCAAQGKRAGVAAAVPPCHAQHAMGREGNREDTETERGGRCCVWCVSQAYQVVCGGWGVIPGGGEKCPEPQPKDP